MNDTKLNAELEIKEKRFTIRILAVMFLFFTAVVKEVCIYNLKVPVKAFQRSF